jgi:sirohydrochlorin cobaltochelatase
MTQSPTLILIAHGSREPRWLASVEELIATLQAAHGPDRVRLAYMQCASPTLAEAVSDTVNSGQTKIRVLPLFLTLGGHVARDIENQVNEIRQARPEVEVQLLAPVGKHPLFMELLDEIVGEGG